MGSHARLLFYAASGCFRKIMNVHRNCNINLLRAVSPPPTDLIESYSYVTLLHQKLFYMDDEKLHLHGRTSDDVGKKKQST